MFLISFLEVTENIFQLIIEFISQWLDEDSFIKILWTVTLGIIFRIIISWFQKRFKKKNNYIDSSLITISKKGYIPLYCVEGLDKKDNSSFEEEKKTVFDFLLKKKLVFRWRYRWKTDERKNILVLGGAGTGKTLLLYKLYKKIVDSNSLLSNPVLCKFYDLRNWSGKEAWRNNIQKDEKTYKRCILLLDGFDEYFDREYYDTLDQKDSPPSKEITDAHYVLNKIYSDCYQFKAVVITSRFYSSFIKFEENNERDIICYHLCDLQTPQIFQSLRKTYQNTFPYLLFLQPNYHSIKKNLENNNSLLRLICKRPLLLRYIELFVNDIFRNSQFVSYTDLYTRIIKKWFEKEADKIGIKNENAIKDFTEMMSIACRHISNKMAKEGRSVLDKEDYLSFLNSKKLEKYNIKHLNTKRRENLINRSFFVRYKNSMNKEKFQFIHRSFYDYFLARHILANEQKDEAKFHLIQIPNEESDIWRFYKDLSNHLHRNKDYFDEELQTINLETIHLSDLVSRLNYFYNNNITPQFVWGIDRITSLNASNYGELIFIKQILTIWSIFSHSTKVFEYAYQKNIFSSIKNVNFIYYRLLAGYNFTSFKLDSNDLRQFLIVFGNIESIKLVFNLFFNNDENYFLSDERTFLLDNTEQEIQSFESVLKNDNNYSNSDLFLSNENLIVRVKYIETYLIFDEMLRYNGILTDSTNLIALCSNIITIRPKVNKSLLPELMLSISKIIRNYQKIYTAKINNQNLRIFALSIFSGIKGVEFILGDYKGNANDLLQQDGVLYFACLSNKLNIVKLLISSFDKQKNDLKTWLDSVHLDRYGNYYNSIDLVLSRKNIDLLRFLTDKFNVNFDFLERKYGLKIEHYNSEEIEQERLEVFKLLLKSGATPKSIRYKNETLLNIAIKHKLFKIVDYLRENHPTI